METTMERNSTFVDVGFGPAFVEQFRLLWMSRRPLLMMIGLLGLLILAGEPWNDSLLARLFTAWPLWVFLIGPFWAFAVWHNEGPSSRLYFWSHPVSRTGHSMARVAAGAAWLVLMYALLILGGVIFALFDGDLVQFGHFGAAAWVGFFTAPLMGYLVISILTVPSDYPIRWFLAFLFGVPILVSLLVEGFGLGELLERIAEAVLVHEDWGALIAAFGPFVFAIERLHGVLRDDVSGGGGLDEPVDIGSWWIAMPLWLLFWLGVVVLLARRHPDVFPRWRRFR